mgnify:CR=1 FL=1
MRKLRNKKIIAFIGLAIVLIILAILAIKPVKDTFSDKDIKITFSDENLYKALKEKINNKISSFDDDMYSILITDANIQSVTSLDLSNCNIKDISGIGKFSNLTEINLSNNQIKDAQELENLNAEINLKNQTIEAVFNEPIKYNADKLIELPQIFRQTKQQDSKIATQADIEVEGAELTDDYKVKLDSIGAGEKQVTVKIVSYRRDLYTAIEKLQEADDIIKKATNDQVGDVKDALKPLGEAKKLMDDGREKVETTEAGTATLAKMQEAYDVLYKATEGKKVTSYDAILKIKDSAKLLESATSDEKTTGTTYSIKYTVSQLISGVENDKIYGSEITPIIIGENLERITLTRNGKDTFDYIIGTKIEEDGAYTLSILDNKGNTNSVNFKIDRTSPNFLQVEEGKIYNRPVVAIVEDENLDTVTLTKDGTQVNNYKNKTTITEDGKYTLVAKDKLGNTSTINFEIDTTMPEITGVEEGRKYTSAVIPVIKDKNLKEVSLLKNGQKAEWFSSGVEVRGAGVYDIIAKDNADNTKQITFEIIDTNTQINETNTNTQGSTINSDNMNNTTNNSIYSLIR